MTRVASVSLYVVVVWRRPCRQGLRKIFGVDLRRRGDAMRRGFSLIELLVAMVMLAILLVLLAQMFSMVSNTWRAGRSQVDNFCRRRGSRSM